MKRFIRNIQAFNQLYPQERVYLHFDNTGYYLGETIWFKAYIAAGLTLQPDTTSGVLYVELLNAKGKILETKKLKITNGQCHGEFYLTLFNADYHAGFYEIRAYTKMMLNFGTATLFSRVFPVFNEPEKSGDYAGADMDTKNNIKGLTLPVVRGKAPKKKRVNLDFYPEGGHSIKGLNGRVAFKATNERGTGIDITGEVLDSKGKSIASFVSAHEGMGIFEYKPDENKNTVKIHDGDNSYQFNLPSCLPNGYALKVNNIIKGNLILQMEGTAVVDSTGNFSTAIDRERYGRHSLLHYYRRKPDYRVTIFEGYSEVKDFYSGRPEREDYLPARFEHSRTLYWNPNVKTDANGRVQIRFYNSAFCEKIDISAEGITKEGILITQVGNLGIKSTNYTNFFR
ncbi:MAG: hypothetical protein LBP72_05420 [Dysgonamonadaceae bacterium]|jgi:hypothetical protein|nr:hypothetical protein [Dysgonamonadaceae bacterium]